LLAQQFSSLRAKQFPSLRAQRGNPGTPGVWIATACGLAMTSLLCHCERGDLRRCERSAATLAL